MLSFAAVNVKSGPSKRCSEDRFQGILETSVHSLLEVAARTGVRVNNQPTLSEVLSCTKVPQHV